MNVLKCKTLSASEVFTQCLKIDKHSLVHVLYFRYKYEKYFMAVTIFIVV